MEILISSLVIITVSFGILGLIYFLRRNKLAVLERLETYTKEEEKSYLMPELNKPLRERFSGIFMEFFTRFSGRFITKNKKEVYERKLMAAGNPNGLTAETYVVFKYLIILFMLILGLLLRNILSLGLCLAIGFAIPDLYLRMHERRRKEAILRSLPDVLDLITVSVQAGLGFDAALQKVVDKFKGPLSFEFVRTLQEMNMGKPRREALRDMADRVNVDDVTTFLGSIIQADQLGVSITNVLALQSEQVRAGRRMRAEETAQRAPVKILIPLVLFIFPTILIVLLGPAVIQLLDTFK